MFIHISVALPLFAVLIGCLKNVPEISVPRSQPDTKVEIPDGASGNLGVPPEVIDRVLSQENLSQARAELDDGKNFELVVMLQPDWRERVPFRLKGGVVKKHEDIDDESHIVGLGDLTVRKFQATSLTGGYLRSDSSGKTGKVQLPFDLLKVELQTNTMSALIGALNKIHRLPGIILAEPNFKMQKIAVPDDPKFPSLWGMTKIQAPETWDSFTGSQENIIAVIDTGIDYTHEDLKDNIWVNKKEIAGNGIDDDGNGYIDDVRGWDFAYGDNDPMDGDSHGTHCAGTVAGRGNNGVGVAGVNWKASLMPVKVLDDTGSGYTYDIYSGIVYAVSNGAKVTSNSYGGGGASSLMASAIQTALDQGVFFIAAAGNESASRASYPAYYSKTYDNVIAVASSETDDSISAFSNTGDGVNIAAPGRNILSTVPGNSYATYSGTSMATPHVAGVVGLLRARAPTKSLNEIRSALLTTVDTVPSYAGKVSSSGRMNLKSAFDSIGGATSPTPTPDPSFSPTPTPGPSAAPTPTPDPSVSPTPTPVPSPAPTPTPTPTPGYNQGLRYKYYHGLWFRLPRFESKTPRSTGMVSDVSLSMAERNSRMGVVFEGQFWVPVSGQYTFYLSSDDGSRLKIDESTVIDNDGLHAAREKSVTLDLSSGFHPIRVEYFQLFWGRQLSLKWSGPGMTRRKMTGAGVFYHK